MIRQLSGLILSLFVLGLASHPATAETIMKMYSVEALPDDTILIEVEVINEGVLFFFIAGNSWHDRNPQGAGNKIVYRKEDCADTGRLPDIVQKT